MQCKNCGIYISEEYSPRRVYCSDYCGHTYRGKHGERRLRPGFRDEQKSTMVNTKLHKERLDYQHRETARTVEEIMKDIVEENEKIVPDPKRIKELFEEKRLAKVLRASL